MGSIPYRMYDVCKKHLVRVRCWGLVDKIPPAFVRVEKLGCAGRRQIIPAILYEVSADKSASISNQAGHRVPLTYLCVAPPGWDRQPGRCAEALQTVSGRPGSPLPVIAAYTYLKQHWQPLQVFTLSQSLFFLLLQLILT
jgi:hypothetical protein